MPPAQSQASQPSGDEPETGVEEAATATVLPEETDVEPVAEMERERVERPERAPRPAPTLARGPAISRAIDHVQEVIADLKSALEEMELALELLEEAERQKLDDEREIKALQKALERVNRFRGGPRSSERASERSQG